MLLNEAHGPADRLPFPNKLGSPNKPVCFNVSPETNGPSRNRDGPQGRAQLGTNLRTSTTEGQQAQQPRAYEHHCGRLWHGDNRQRHEFVERIVESGNVHRADRNRCATHCCVNRIRRGPIEQLLGTAAAIRQ
jgi:hypothetical protein